MCGVPACRQPFWHQHFTACCTRSHPAAHSHWPPLQGSLRVSCALPQAGAFRIGDTAGTIDNITTCRLHRPGSVGFVSKSGGMSNEMYNVLARATDGLYEGAWCWACGAGHVVLGMWCWACSAGDVVPLVTQALMRSGPGSSS